MKFLFIFLAFGLSACRARGPSSSLETSSSSTKQLVILINDYAYIAAPSPESRDLLRQTQHELTKKIALMLRSADQKDLIEFSSYLRLDNSKGDWPEKEGYLKFLKKAIPRPIGDEEENVHLPDKIWDHLNEVATAFVDRKPVIILIIPAPARIAIDGNSFKSLNEKVKSNSVRIITFPIALQTAREDVLKKTYFNAFPIQVNLKDDFENLLNDAVKLIQSELKLKSE